MKRTYSKEFKKQACELVLKEKIKIHIMTINWKVSLKNVFLLTTIPSVVAVVYTILGLFGVVQTATEDAIMNAVTAIIIVSFALGVLVDLTTMGVRDSERVLTYDEPSVGSIV
ncbi:MAG: phage holin [Faecalibacterium sp.]|nr:phage holin [Ruminococcus sp.]MCM1391516.1 phage holin [Ruminococcus sp.]MCM1485504.1 phage holin [Faecalibacterium sp.]